MKLATVEEYIERNFTERSRPAKTVVWRWIREGKLAAEKKGRRYYIPVDENGRPVHETGANELVDRVLG